MGGERIDVVVHEAARLADAIGALHAVMNVEPSVEADMRRLTVSTTDGAAALANVLRALDAAGIAVDDLALRRATLDDVFLHLTGHVAEAANLKILSAKEEVA
jgi:ABC-2 type transport system ATP-binding protein